MTRVRFSSWIVLGSAGFALLSLPSLAPALQPEKDNLPQKTSAYNQVSRLKSAGGLSDPKSANEAFAGFAKFVAEYIAHPKVYTAPQEFRVEPANAPPPYTPEDLIREINRHILVPMPGSKVNRKDADYMRGLAEALDSTLKEKIENGELIVRINATRLLAAACRSGEKVHYPTVTGILTNANTPPAVKYYAFQAAGNLLAAYDFNNFRSRQHTGDPKQVSELIAALQDSILKPEAAYPSLIPAKVVDPKAAKDPKGVNGAEGKLESIPADQQQVISFIRRGAIRALGQVRFADGVPGGDAHYPAFTLARIAVSDPALSPPPSVTEVAEAVIGICNMSPPKGKAESEQYGHAMSDVVATGVVTFARSRAGDPSDKSIAWRGYAARLVEALKNWRPLFDPAFNALQPNVFLANLVPPPVEGVVAEAERRVLAPIDGTLMKVDLQGLVDYRNNTLRTSKKWTLVPFSENPNLVLPKTN